MIHFVDNEISSFSLVLMAQETFTTLVIIWFARHMSTLLKRLTLAWNKLVSQVCKKWISLLYAFVCDITTFKYMTNVMLVFLSLIKIICCREGVCFAGVPIKQGIMSMCRRLAIHYSIDCREKDRDVLIFFHISQDGYG